MAEPIQTTHATETAFATDAATLQGLVAGYFRAMPMRVAWLACLSLVLAGLAVVPPVAIAQVVDAAIGGRGGSGMAMVAGGAIVLLAASDAALTLVRRRLAIATEIEVRSDAAIRHFRACVRLPLRDYAGGNEAALIRSFDDLDRVAEFVASRSVELLAEALIAAASIALMLWVEWRLALVFIPLSALSLASAAYLFRAAKDALDLWLPVRDSRFGYLVECITAMLTLKTLSAHANVLAPFTREQDREQLKLQAWRDRMAVADSAARFWTIAVPGLGVVCGAIMLIGGALTAGQLLLFLSVSGGLGGSLAALQGHLREWQESRAALDRMRALGVGRPEPLRDTPGPTPPPMHPDIRLRDLRFRHAGASVDTLSDTSLTVAPGEHIAIAGRSGEGKTTLAYLIARLYEPDRGLLEIGGPPMPLDLHRRAVLLVPHTVTVFDASLRDNIRLWDENVGDLEIWRALEMAALATQARVWAGGLDARLGARGNPLSAGQRQRVGLARAFIRRPEVLILDEATSALDTATEQDVLRAARAFMRGRVLIVITHRDAVAASFDRVIRVAGGRAVDNAPPHHSP